MYVSTKKRAQKIILNCESELYAVTESAVASIKFFGRNELLYKVDVDRVDNI